MTSLALFEARKVVRNPLLWLGAVLLFAIAALNARDYWPTVPDDAGWVHENLVVLAPFALLAGAGVGLRDRAGGAERVVASTPAAARGILVPARMAALAAVSLAAATLAFAALAVMSYVRGGHGRPDPFLVLDGGLYVALAAAAGFAIGYVSGSRILSLLAAPVLPGLVFYLQGNQSGGVTQPTWLLPSPRLPGRFGPLGYLPDVFPIHAAYLAGALVLLTGVVWVSAGRRDGATTLRLGRAVAVAGAGLALVSAGWLVTQPSEVHVFGASPSEWVEIHSARDYELLPRQAGRGPNESARRLATECAESRGVTVCVFPDYGRRLAEAIAREASVLASFDPLDGVPQKITMVPTAAHTGVNGCTHGEELLVGSTRWSVEFQQYESVADEAFYCAVYGPRMLASPAANALHAWFTARLSRDLGGKAFVREVRQGWGSRAATAVRGLRDVPVLDAVERLAPVWDDVRARELSLRELRAALRA